MKEEILSIASDLREGSMITSEAKRQLLDLFGVSNSDADKLSRLQKDIDECYEHEDEENARASVCDTTGYADCQHWQNSSFGCSGCNKTFKKQTDY